MGLTNVRVAGQLCIAAVSCRNAVLLGKVLGAFQALWCDGCYLRIEEDRNRRALVTELLSWWQRKRAYLSTWWCSGARVFMATLKSWLICPAPQRPHLVAMFSWMVGDKWDSWCFSNDPSCWWVTTLEEVARAAGEKYYCPAVQPVSLDWGESCIYILRMQEVSPSSPLPPWGTGCSTQRNHAHTCLAVLLTEAFLGWGGLYWSVLIIGGKVFNDRAKITSRLWKSAVA